ncbi:type VI-A CRISPR-associated RNA-guided ribonuclease Cas13a [Thalassospira alkalitolerans]|uniref:type VI-A CRISPR-associated RNA-guided ribonuclease Cas13a n=1 Tax=Thalassospira alkalitolerans TaxID=1293890 RepID=UPI003AA97332
MKILRSKGLSYTEAGKSGQDSGKLARGLALKGENALTPSEFRGELRVAPEKLADFVGEDYALVLRQTVSVLDKIIRKPGSLRKCALQTYVDRTFLAAQLWRRLSDRCKDGISSLPEGQEAFKQFSASWNWKVHPYARKQCDTNSPQTDMNAKFIIDFGDPRVTREDANGRWHNVYWQEKAGKPDYAATADAIFDHLFVQELTIKGKVREKLNSETGKVKPTGCGLIAGRGASIAKSANDPRTPRSANKVLPRRSDVLVAYFESDIAAKIFDAITDETNQKASFDARRVGSMLFDHFKLLLDAYASDDETRRELWKLHNKVRQFYQKTLRGERFRRAFKEAHNDNGAADGSSARDIVKKVLPENGNRLCDILGAKDRNADISKLIRLGKMVVHASNLPADTSDPQKAFEDRMNYFATSDGQSEIKRNEAFTRVWRNSVAMSLRTLKAWVDPQNTVSVTSKGGFENEDIASANVGALLCGERFNIEQFNAHLPLVFGDKAVANNDGKSRASIFADISDADKVEMQWAFLRLAAELRNRCNHFNTKDRLVSVLSGGVLKPMSSDQPIAIANRRGADVSDRVLGKLGELLAFDRRLQANVLLDDLNRLEMRRYVSGEDIEALLVNIRPVPGHDLIPPKFMSVISRANETGKPAKDRDGNVTQPEKHLAGFAKLDLDNIAMTNRGPNHFKIGVLRMLYSAGFQAWLNDCEDADKTFVGKTVERVLKAQHARVTRAKERAFYVTAESILDEMQLEKAASLNELFAKLLSRSSAQERENQTYRARAGVQKDRADILNRFKLDLFGDLFGTYLIEQNLGWIWRVKDLLPEDEKPQPLTTGDLGEAEGKRDGPWKAQFYGWLYLVPSDEIALLRYQFRKTLVLEGKSAGETPADLITLLDDIDELMGLYTAVQSAGFSGKEHVARLGADTSFYEDADQFAQIYSEENETHHMSFPGTRRGLRQILRFGDLAVLKKVFDRHKITREEVDTFASLLRDDTKKLFEKRNDLRDQIFAAVDARKTDTPQFMELCGTYRDLASQTALYQFQAAGARLTEHARLHHLLLKVVGRLTDFTLTWERDQHCLMLGMLYRVFTDQNGLFEIDVRDQRVGIMLDDGSRQIFENRVLDDLDRFDVKLGKRVLEQLKSDLEAGFVPLWGDGFALSNHYQLQSLLPEGYRAQFNRYFGKLEAENPRDVAADKRRKKAGHMQRNTGRPQRNRESYQSLKSQVRNDFAHFNILSSKKARLNLNYAVNAVRSLLSYDRKLKNAVPKAIKDIIADEGLMLDWQLHEDRLRNARIYPKCETHLATVRAGENTDVTFLIPQASVRYTSMVKALFEFDAGGYRAQVGPAADKKRKGRLTYPEAVWRQYGDAIPECLRKVTYPELGSDFK